MKKNGRILIVDDEHIWRDLLVEKLQKDGFHAEAVPSSTEALKRLEETLYHLLILDIRLDNDTSNIDGVELLGELKKRGLSEATKVIMFSAHGTKDHMRLAFKDYGVADFLSKDPFDAHSFLENVHTAFSEHVNINLGLDVIWEKSVSEQAVLNLEVNGMRVERGTPLCERMTSELEDLLCRLFSDAEGILVRPLMPTPSRSGTGVLWVRPFYAAAAGHAVVVKFGYFAKIEEEQRRFKTFVRPFVAGARNTTIVNTGRTPHLGGIVYSLLGAANDNWVEFAHFYRTSTAEQVREAIKRLFQDTCSAWYASPGRLYPHNLTEMYGNQLSTSHEEIKQGIVKNLSSVLLRHGKLSFDALSERHDFVDPFEAIKGKTFVYTTYECITHGDLNQHNILMDSAKGMWLVDFENTERSHILRDVATLDAVVRFQLLGADEATLDKRLLMERALNSIDRFKQVETLTAAFTTENTAVARAYATVVQLRLLAQWLVDQNPDDDMSEYYVALLYNALATLDYSSLQPAQQEHALLSASLLAQKLTANQV